LQWQTERSIDRLFLSLIKDTPFLADSFPE
jgi:hypothetical protein